MDLAVPSGYFFLFFPLRKELIVDKLMGLFFFLPFVSLAYSASLARRASSLRFSVLVRLDLPASLVSRLDCLTFLLRQ